MSSKNFALFEGNPSLDLLLNQRSELLVSKVVQQLGFVGM
jgi:hypothetical protein